MSDPTARLRLDKWLWAARFFKTRSLAADALDRGKVRLNGATVKPAREVGPGDLLEIHNGESAWTVRVLGINAYRRPAPEARLLYEETAESQAKRQQQLELRKLAPMPGADIKGRPTKRAGRQLRRFSGSPD
ncbi:MAG: RNA-binding S4 domain-containing protein [Betaproteobacteria bacterium]